MSIRYVYHAGSGTYMNADECLVLEVSDEVSEAVNRGDVSIVTCEVERESSLEEILAEVFGNLD